MILDALKKASPEQRDIILNALGNPDIKLEQISAVRSIVEDTGALEFNRKAAKSLVEQAKSALPTDLMPEGREFLLAVADYVVNRDN